MKLRIDWRRRQIACGLAVLLALPFSEAGAAPLQPVFETEQPQIAATNQDQAQGADGVVQKAKPDASDANKKDSEGVPFPSSPVVAQQADSASALPNGPTQQSSPTEPVGTAAAPYEKPVGSAVARPAGAAIAPAKQKRSRSLTIRIAIVVGTAVAVGTVVALTTASPSKPH